MSLCGVPLHERQRKELLSRDDDGDAQETDALLLTPSARKADPTVTAPCIRTATHATPQGDGKIWDVMSQRTRFNAGFYLPGAWN